MIALQLAPVVLSLVVLGAHFLRAGNIVVVTVVVVVLGVLAVRRPWAARVAQSTLVFGTMVWCQTLVQLVVERTQSGKPAVRMAIILGTVVLVTFVSVLLLQVGALRQRYRIGQNPSQPNKPS